VPPSDRAALAQAMQRLLADTGLAAGFAEAGRTWALSEGSVATMADRYEALYAGHAR